MFSAESLHILILTRIIERPIADVQSRVETAMRKVY